MAKGKSQSMEVLKIAGVGLLALWVFWGLAAFLFVSGEDEGKAGLFGDFFGAFNALVSVLGFGAVLYSLQRQHEDANEAETRYREERERQQTEAREAETRHNELIAAQQRIFEQNATITLFKKRYEAFRAVFEIVEYFIAENRTKEKINPNHIISIKHHQLKCHFLFSDPAVTEAFKPLVDKCEEMINATNTFHQYRPGSEDATTCAEACHRTWLELISLSKTLNQAMSQNLVLPPSTLTKKNQ